MKKKELRVELFPFLTILLSTMGVLAFISLSLLFSAPEGTEKLKSERNSKKSDENGSDSITVKFELIGKPDFIHPHYILCLKDKILIHDSGIEIPFNENYGYFLFYDYLNSLESLNQSFHEKYKDNDEYVIFGVYPTGIETYFRCRQILQMFTNLNFGTQPILPNWKLSSR